MTLKDQFVYKSLFYSTLKLLYPCVCKINFIHPQGDFEINLFNKLSQICARYLSNKVNIFYKLNIY